MAKSSHCIRIYSQSLDKNPGKDTFYFFTEIQTIYGKRSLGQICTFGAYVDTPHAHTTSSA